MMKELIPMNEYGVFADRQEQILIDSRFVAEKFDKEHKTVIRSIENIMSNDLIDNFNQHNFVPIEYKDDRNRKQPAYAMTLNGFQLLISTFTGEELLPLKVIYFNKIDEIKEQLRTLKALKHDFPLLMKQIQMTHENPQLYHYSNECDMLNRIVTGYSAKQIREQHGLPKGTSIRPYLTTDETAQLEELQRVDVGLMVVISDFEERKQRLIQYHSRILSKRQLIGA